MKKSLKVSGLLLIFAYLTLCIVMYFSDITFDSFAYVEISGTLVLLGLFAFLFSVLYDHIVSENSRTAGAVIIGLMVVGLFVVFLTMLPLVTIYQFSGHNRMKIFYGYGQVCVDGQHISPGSDRYLVVNTSEDSVILRKRTYKITNKSNRDGTVYGLALNAEQEQNGDPNTDVKIKVIPPNSYFGFKHDIDTIFGRPPYIYEGSIDNEINNCFSIYYLDLAQANKQTNRGHDICPLRTSSLANPKVLMLSLLNTLRCPNLVTHFITYSL